VFEVNVAAPLRLMQLSAPLLRTARGAVLNVTSDAAVESYEGWGGYGASKAALEQLSSVFAAENPEVRTYWVDPGDMDTEMHRAAAPDDDPNGLLQPDSVARALLHLLRQRIPSGRYRATDLPGLHGPVDHGVVR
jgi:NAD(P)-dependent dehydrogenase (short-subunit alcohol dehydrogenase family)